MSTVRRASRAFARVASGLAATTSGSTSTVVSPRVPVVPVAARARAVAFARAHASASGGATTPVVDRYGASKGPMAGLLRVLRDDGALTTRELFDRAVERDVPTHSMRHMKGLLAKMKAIDRVKATPPGAASGASGEEGAVVQAGRGRRARGNYTFSITETGMKHIEKLDRSVPPPAPSA